jgi:FMN-dependent NADH-azoreductase
MTLFRLDASIRDEGSASREIADIVEAEWLAAHPGDRIERRHIGVSQHMKTWIDLVMTDPRASGAVPPPLLSGKRVVLATVRGGAYAAGKAFSLANA